MPVGVPIFTDPVRQSGHVGVAIVDFRGDMLPNVRYLRVSDRRREFKGCYCMFRSQSRL